MAFKPLKMGLRVAHLAETWDSFEEKYQRITQTYKELYRIELTDEEIKLDLDELKQL